MDFPQSRSCTTGFGVCTTGWRPRLHLCTPSPGTPSPALRLRVVAYLVINEVGVDGVGGIFPFFTFFFVFLRAFSFFFAFLRFSSLFFLRFSLILLEDKGKRLQFTANMGNFTPTPSAPTPFRTSRIFRLQPGLETENSFQGEPGRGKTCSHCNFQNFHSLSKENQVSLVRTFLSEPGSLSKISRLRGWGWKNDPENKWTPC